MAQDLAVQSQKEQDENPTLSTFKEWFEDYQTVKQDEINEKQKAFDYYNGHQWTQQELDVLNRRGQPPSVQNTIAPKIRDLKGINIESRQEPVALARTGADEQVSDTATALLRFISQEQNIDSKTNTAFTDFLVGGYEIMKADVVNKVNRLKQTTTKEIRVKYIRHDNFFYDPTSLEFNFSDADFMGEYKWIKMSKARKIIKDLDSSADNEDIGGMTNEQQPQEKLWIDTSGKRVRIVEMWYRLSDGWHFVMFWGSGIIRQRISPYLDEFGMPRHPYSAMSDEIDQDGDRYGEVRAMISPQDGINHRKSKMQHQLSVRQFMYSKGAVDDVNKTKSELSRADGAIEINGEVNKEFQMIPQNDQIQGQAVLLQEDKNYIESIGANQALLGQSGSSASGKAIRAQQNAGLVQLSSVFSKHKDMKLRLYELIFGLVKQFWTDERVIRITDDPKSAKFITINGLQADPATGQPTTLNSVADMNVDLIIEESPSAMTQQLEDFESIIALAGSGLDPNSPIFKLLVELSNISEARKKVILDGEEMTPEEQQAVAEQAQGQQQKQEAFELMELQKLDAGNKKTIAETQNTEAKTTQMAFDAGMIASGVAP